MQRNGSFQSIQLLRPTVGERESTQRHADCRVLALDIECRDQLNGRDRARTASVSLPSPVPAGYQSRPTLGSRYSVDSHKLGIVHRAPKCSAIEPT